MSRTIDEKVVSLQFDNANFERNVSTSMSTLEKLKHALRLDGATDGFRDIENASGKVNLSNLIVQNESVQKSFRVLEEVAVGVYRHIGEQAAQLAEKTLYSLSGIENVTDGYKKYIDKTSSVQTLLNSTGKDLNEINGYLDTLMRFSDETSYGFTEMARSLAQLTSSGGDVEKLIPMITGIANATAFAGKGPAEFSRAIYNLNQSYGAGYLKFMDWKSLELAGVASKDLKQSFIDTAIELGRLNKNAKTTKGHLVDIGSFGETLKDQWADTEVMEATFGKFSQFTQMADAMVEAGEYTTYSKAYEALAQLEENYGNIYLQAAKAAQEAKTFNEAIEATKDAVASSWLQTFEIIFGDYEQAKRTWTNLANDLYDIFAIPRQNFNDMLGRAFKSQYDQLKDIFYETGEDFDKLDSEFKKFLKDSGYDVEKFIHQYGSMSYAIAQGDAVIKDAQDNVASINELFQQFLGFGYTSTGLVPDGYLTKLINGPLDNINQAIDAVEKVIEPLEKIQKLYDSIWNGEFGNGADRVAALAEAEIDYATAQGLINKMAAEGHRAGYKLTADDIAYLSEEQLKNIGITGEMTDEIGELALAIHFAQNNLNDYTDEELEALGVTKERALELSKIGNNTLKLMQRLNGRSGQVLLSQSIQNITQSIINMQNVLSDAWEKIFGWDFSEIILRGLLQINEFTEGIRNFTESFLENVTASSLWNGALSILSGTLQVVTSAFKLLWEIGTQLISGVLSVLSDLFEDLNIDIGDISLTASEAIDKITQWLDENNTIFELIQNASDIAKDAAKNIKDWIAQFVDLEKVSTVFSTIQTSMEDIVSGKTKFSDVFSFDNLFKSEAGLQSLQSVFLGTGEAVQKGMQKPAEAASGVLATLATNVVNAFGATKTVLSDTFTKIYEKLKMDEEQIAAFEEKMHDFTNTLMGMGSMYMILKFFQNIGEGLNSLAAPFRSFSDVLGAFQGVGYELQGYVRALKTNIQINNVFKIALAVAILTGAMYALAKLAKDDGKALAYAVAAVFVMTAAIYMLSLAIKALSESVFSEDKMKSATQAVIGIGVLIAAIALSAWVMSRALKNIDNLEHPLRSAVGLIIIMVGLVATIAGFIWAAKQLNVDTISINKGFGKELVGAMLGLVAFALAIKVFVGVLKDLDQLQIKDPVKVFVALITVIGSFVAVGLALKGVAGSTAFVLMAFAGSVWSLVKVLKRLSSEFNNDDWNTGLVRLAEMIGLMAVVIIATQFVSKRAAASAAALMVSIAGSVLLMGLAIKQLSQLNEDEIRRGALVAGALYAVIAVLGGFASLLSGLGKTSFQGALGTSLIIVTAAGSLYLMAGAMMVLNRFSEEELKKTSSVIEGLLISVGAMIALVGVGFGLTKGNAYQAVNSIIKTAILVAVLAGAIAGLTYVYKYNPEGFAATIDALTEIMKNMAILLAAMTFMTWLSSPSKSILVLIGVLASISTALGLLSSFTDADKVIKIAESLSKVIKALGEAMFYMGEAELLSFGSTAAIASFGKAFAIAAAVLTVIAGIIAGLESAGILDHEKVTAVIDSMIFFIEKVGEFVGAFVGGIIAGFTEIATSGLPEAADNLSLFAQRIRNFLDLTIPEGFSSTLTSIGDIFSTLGSHIGDIKKVAALESVNGIDNLESFFTKLGTSLKSMSDSMEDVNITRLNTAGKVIEAISSLVEAMPQKEYQGFIPRLLFGEKESFTTFSKNLSNLAAGLTAFSADIDSYDNTVVDEKLGSIKELLEMEAGLGNTGGFLGWILGADNLGSFGNRMSNFGAGLKLFSDSMLGFDSSTVGVAKNAADTLSQLERGISSSPTLFGYLGIGDEKNYSLGDFGNRIKTFGEGLRDGFTQFNSIFSTIVDNKFNPDKVDKFRPGSVSPTTLFDVVQENADGIIAVAEKFKKLEEVAPKGGAVFNDTLLTTLGQGLAVFSGGFQDLSLALAEIEELPTVEEATQVADVVKALMSIAEVEGSETMGGILDSIGTGLQSMAEGLTGLFEGFTSSFSMGSMFTTGTDETGLQQDGGFMAMIQAQIAGIFTNEDLVERIRQGGLNIARTYLMAIAMELLGKEYENAKNIASADAENIADRFRKVDGGKKPYREVYEEIGRDYLEGLLNGISDPDLLGAIYAQVSSIASTMASLMQFGLDEHSPSRLTYGMGVFFVQGLINGISDLTGDAAKSAEVLADTVSNAVRSAMAASDEVLSDEYSPVITPVLDTSNIIKGSSAINSMLNASKTYNAALAIEASRSSSVNSQNTASQPNNISVTVNVDKAGGELTDADAAEFGRRIADEVNIRLGLKLKGGR